MSSEAAWDLIGFGETMVRLSAPRGVRLDDAGSLELTIGGTESNVAVALSGLGRRTCWVSALPEHPLGRRIANELRSRGVDTSHVRWIADGRVGVYFLDPGVEPRPTRVFYDRADSAVARIDPDTIDPGLVAHARALHLTGITPALSAGCAEVCARLAAAASNHGVPLVFDMNYRSRLWSAEAARRGLATLTPQATLLLCGLSDAGTIWGWSGTPDEVALNLAASTGAETVVLTLGSRGALVVHQRDVVARQAAIPAEIVDPIGAGDAFAAGFIHHWLDQRNDLAGALRSGIAMAALKMTVVGDHASATAAELSEAIALIERPGIDIVR